MNDEKKIEQLLAAFYNGDTMPEEETALAEFFNRETLSEKWDTDRDLFNVLYNPERITLPKGVSERLESAVDAYIAQTASRNSYSKTRRLYFSILSAAATILLCIGLFFAIERKPGQDFIADTYTNPQDAAIAAEQALLFVSAKLNQGLYPLEKVKEGLNKTNEILYDKLKLN